MSLEKCSECKSDFLTETDIYLVIPIEGYRMVCINCVFKSRQKKIEILEKALIKINNSDERINCGESAMQAYRALEEIKDI